MKHSCFSIIFLLSFLVVSIKSYSQEEFPVLEGFFFGQKPPGLVPEVFAPGVVSIDGRYEGAVSFAPELDEIYFGANNKDQKTHIYFSRLEGNRWTPIKRADFTNGEKEEEIHPFVTLDGKRIYFVALKSDLTENEIWYVNRLENSWSKAIKLDSPVNNDQVFFPNVAKNGDLYYFNLSKGKTYNAYGGNGDFREVKEVSMEFSHHVFIAPSQDYLVATSKNKEDESRKDNDIYVYFKNSDGAWIKPISLGDAVNSSFNEKSPTITPDGKYLFFGRSEKDGKNGLANIYWVSTKVIENLRPKM
ncbi:WD40-like Beta Propeller Repeat [Alteromonadaceae bacterium Bs31]|nr:WD40-like Beta Propeller Repeat [Alteromonadaceae bacterium Bs31]